MSRILKEMAIPEVKAQIEVVPDMVVQVNPDVHRGPFPACLVIVTQVFTDRRIEGYVVGLEGEGTMVELNENEFEVIGHSQFLLVK